MTNESKNQRKRRLQLNAEEYAPPSNLHDASDKPPRLDDAWVKFYGGNTEGGAKRLSSIDDDEPVAVKINPPVVEQRPQAHAAESPGSVEWMRDTPAPVHHPDQNENKGVVEARGDMPAGRVLTPVRDFRRETADQPAPITRPSLVGKEKVARTSNETSGGKVADDPASAPLPPTDAPQSFETWLQRWSPWLKKGGAIKVCRAFFDLTHARGSDECFTSNSVVMQLTELSRAQCIRNIHYLIEMGFLEELGEVNNRDAKGTYYRFNLTPRALAS